MRIGAFQIKQPLPEFVEPHALAVLHPWIDIGAVGSTTLELLENHFHAKSLGKLVSPGNFFDFTRYRPSIRLVEGQSQIEIPNSFINYAKQSESKDFLLFHLLEPHMLGEDYANSVLKVLQKLGVKRYCLLGSMYDAVPHTKPLIVTGGTAGEAKEELCQLGVQPSDYEGPTTIAVLISQEAPKYKIEVVTLIVHLPQYVRLEEDYIGALRLLELLCSLYHLPLNLEEVRRKAEMQRGELSLAVDKEPQLKPIVEQLEMSYETRVNRVEQEQPKLSPDIEKFLRDVTKRFGQS